MSKGFTLWFTGLSGSGKTTVSTRVAEILRQRGQLVELLDGDVVRQNLTAKLGFSKEDRDENIRRIGWMCELLTRNRVAALAAAISPYNEAREKVRARVQPFVLVYCEAPIEVLAERDVKGLYKKALAGEIKHFTGVDDPYEPPENPDVRLDTAHTSVEHCVGQVLAALEERGLLPPA
ncbi:MAG: adenylyl-sulfate kinase [Polyangia bacterium]|jgi:adenylylsulfate kinase|nr:adenylyl-sulfate kinase [Polyangia bacterium]